jgi:hypothetical protein
MVILYAELQDFALVGLFRAVYAFRKHVLDFSIGAGQAFQAAFVVLFHPLLQRVAGNDVNRAEVFD